MSKLTAKEKELAQLRTAIKAFDFKDLFNQLGWSNPATAQQFSLTVNNQDLPYQHIAQLAGVVVLQITTAQIPDNKTRLALHEHISRLHHEHLLIFVDGHQSQSCWSWLKRDANKTLPRSHSYFKGQSGDLLLSKIVNMSVDFQDFDDNGNIAIVEVIGRLRNALDSEPVTKKFFADFAHLHGNFVQQIQGINNEKDRAWYGSVLLHRLMFIWFLQKKYFLDNGNGLYLTDKLSHIQQTLGDNQYYPQFLKPLFFEGFAKPESNRSTETNKLLGNIRYLNGGLFLPHTIEERYAAIHVNDQAFSDLFALFSRYTWNLNDSLNGADNEINPDVLGYIFEKYINQKAFGAYYTRPEITDYLSERTISKLILDKINRYDCQSFEGLAVVKFQTLPELLYKLDAPLCRELLHNILPKLSLVDPACGSGAFLVAAMKTLIAIYAVIIEKLKSFNDADLMTASPSKDWQSYSDYFIKKEIIKNNLYGVDIMPEATEIAKLRLFLALVSSAQKVDDLEPLPNIDFNIMAGNSLIGLLNVEADKFNQLDIFWDNNAKKTYTEVVNEKNRLIACYKDSSSYSDNLTELRDNISAMKAHAYGTLNRLLLDEFEQLKIKYEQATWNDAKNKEDKPVKRNITLADIADLQPFHWGYEFDAIFARGGFDAVITNPPWEVFKPQAKEFFAEHSDLVSKNKMSIKDFEKKQAELVADADIKAAWLAYQSRFPFVSLYFRSSPQYRHQTTVVNGKKTGSDINLYKLFLEQSFNLLRDNGECGIVIPSGIYTDLGATGLRRLLFNETHVTGLFCFENRKLIFEGVDSRFKFVVLTFVKNPTTNLTGLKDLSGFLCQSFPVAFMRHHVAELATFPNAQSLHISTDLIQKLSPDSQSIMEFKTALDVQIAEKMLRFPLLGEQLSESWNLKLTREFDMTNDSHLFKTEKGEGCLPLYEGKMIHQFSHTWGEPKYWLNEMEARQDLLGKNADVGQVLDYQSYRLAFRDIARNTDLRTLISTIIPPAFHGNKLPTAKVINEKGGVYLSNAEQLFICGVWNSFVVDWMIRQKVTTTLNFFYIYQLPIPRLTEKDPQFKAIVERAAALICTTPEFDELQTELDLSGFKNLKGLYDNAQLRAELDAIIAHCYGLTENEFAHILNTFPIVKDDIKAAALNEFKNTQGEN